MMLWNCPEFLYFYIFFSTNFFVSMMRKGLCNSTPIVYRKICITLISTTDKWLHSFSSNYFLKLTFRCHLALNAVYKFLYHFSLIREVYFSLRKLVRWKIFIYPSFHFSFLIESDHLALYKEERIGLFLDFLKAT